MAAFNPYYVDEIVAQTEKQSNYFGLIVSKNEVTQDELCGYEVTLSGELVLPELKQQPENEE
jgi:hypothetical protein